MRSPFPSGKAAPVIRYTEVSRPSDSRPGVGPTPSCKPCPVLFQVRGNRFSQWRGAAGDVSQAPVSDRTTIFRRRGWNADAGEETRDCVAVRVVRAAVRSSHHDPRGTQHRTTGFPVALPSAGAMFRHAPECSPTNDLSLPTWGAGGGGVPP